MWRRGRRQRLELPILQRGQRASRPPVVVLAAFLGVVCLSARATSAHPGVGIVMDARGTVYYTDLTHVWRIASDGTRAIAVQNVHTHELWLDAEGNLYGEHLWYEGEATDRWGHYVWRLRPDGRRDTIVGPRAGFLTDYSFVRDRSGAMYWVDHDRQEIRTRRPDGVLAAVARLPPGRPGWMTATSEGRLFLTLDHDLLCVEPDGRVTVHARSLAERAFTQIHVSDRHALMGVWSDARGHVYVAVWGGRMVKRVAPDGAVSVVARSAPGWGPTGGFVAPNGDLWVLESSITNAVRVRRLARDGRSRTWP